MFLTPVMRKSTKHPDIGNSIEDITCMAMQRYEISLQVLK